MLAIIGRMHFKAAFREEITQQISNAGIIVYYEDRLSHTKQLREREGEALLIVRGRSGCAAE
jgi:hypothetical protein